MLMQSRVVLQVNSYRIDTQNTHIVEFLVRGIKYFPITELKINSGLQTDAGSSITVFCVSEESIFEGRKVWNESDIVSCDGGRHNSPQCQIYL